eukprot:scaffold336_cov250-Pinguiococcus_pyrenoidosus.AAC.15
MTRATEVRPRSDRATRHDTKSACYRGQPRPAPPPELQRSFRPLHGGRRSRGQSRSRRTGGHLRTSPGGPDSSTPDGISSAAARPRPRLPLGISSSSRRRRAGSESWSASCAEGSASAILCCSSSPLLERLSPGSTAAESQATKVIRVESSTTAPKEGGMHCFTRKATPFDPSLPSTLTLNPSATCISKRWNIDQPWAATCRGRSTHRLHEEHRLDQLPLRRLRNVLCLKDHGPEGAEGKQSDRNRPHASHIAAGNQGTAHVQARRLCPGRRQRQRPQPGQLPPVAIRPAEQCRASCHPERLQKHFRREKIQFSDCSALQAARPAGAYHGLEGTRTLEGLALGARRSSRRGPWRS